MLLLLVNVWSLFIIVIVGGRSTSVASFGKSHCIVGASLPVAEQLKTTSVSPSFSFLLGTCTCAVYTFDIPLWWNNWNQRHLKCYFHNYNDFLITLYDYIIWLIWLYSCADFTLHCKANVFSLRAIGVHIEWADIAAFILPRDIAQSDSCEVEGRFSKDQFSTVRLKYQLSKPIAVSRHGTDGLPDKPLPHHLAHAWSGATTAVNSR